MNAPQITLRYTYLVVIGPLKSSVAKKNCFKFSSTGEIILNSKVLYPFKNISMTISVELQYINSSFST